MPCCTALDWCSATEASLFILVFPPPFRPISCQLGCDQPLEPAADGAVWPATVSAPNSRPAPVREGRRSASMLVSLVDDEVRLFDREYRVGTTGQVKTASACSSLAPRSGTGNHCAGGRIEMPTDQPSAALSCSASASSAIRTIRSMGRITPRSSLSTLAGWASKTAS